jgi:trans-2,3-dihydro-3-hydroxyanthranilate isomerase
VNRYSYVTLDVFTTARFGGNQLAVILDARGLSDAHMQAIAKEFNFSETTFVLPPQNAANTAQVRIFTPGGELPFAGHPTVGTAFALAGLSKDAATIKHLVFEEGVGDVPVAIERNAQGQVTRTVLTSPRNPALELLTLPAETVAAMLHLPLPALHAALPVQAWGCGVPFIMMPLANRDALRATRLDTAIWRSALAAETAQKPYPCVFDAATRTAWVRMFAPGLGVAEDPATGSAAAALAGYLAAHIETADGMFAWTIHQGVEMGRPSEIALSFERMGGAARNVRVGGSSVLVMQGMLHI